MRDRDLPALLVSSSVNVGWISGFTGSHGYVLLTPERAMFATDSRYTLQAAEQCAGFEQILLKTSIADEVVEAIKSLGVSRIGFESEQVTYAGWESYRDKLGAGFDLVPAGPLLDSLRMVKDAGEIALIEAACRVAERAWDHIAPLLKPGAVEREIMLELEWHVRRDGGAEVAFDTIVASGPRSALPHGRAADRVLQTGDFVTIDFGARLNGYCSDITRTVVLGEPTDRQRQVYDVVHAALYAAIAAIRPGAGGREVDSVARDLIRDAGFGSYFGHGLGHGLGRLVHDGQAFSVRSDVTLKEGMVVTVEPGIYIPDWGGVRIEHDVVVTPEGARILTPAPTTDLICL